MSVINQMLKDLDKRQQTEGLSRQQGATLAAVNAPGKINWFVLIAVILVLNIVGILIWQLYSENQQLKNTAVVNSSAANLPEQPSAEVISENKMNSHQAELKQNESSSTVSTAAVNNDSRQPAADPSDDNAPSQIAGGKAAKPEKAAKQGQIAELGRTDLPAPEQTKALVSVTSGSQPIKNSQLAAKEPAVAQSAPQLKISRKQLSPQELVEQKLTQAEQALNSEQLSRAETLFEDILLVSPENKAARKQLAALWFGRKSYQAAHNLLSQGIALAPNDSEYRMMKARIYLSQGQQLAAVNTLKVLNALEDVEYQALLATNAQQLAQYQTAISAYQLLVKLQPTTGRWWLGLAVAYDSNSQFEQAVPAYRQARDSGELSESARQFAGQRLQQLGE